MDELLSDGNGEHEYEEALDLLVRKVPVGWVAVDGLPWTEIDFPEDWRRGETEILPKIQQVMTCS
jgi:choline kinase